LLLTDKVKYLISEAIFLLVGAAVFCYLAFEGKDINTLLFLFGCMLTLHYFSIVLRQESILSIVILVCLFCVYLALFFSHPEWISLLLLPYLVNFGIIKKFHLLIRIIIVALLPNILFIVLFAGNRLLSLNSRLDFSNIWFGVVVLAVNPALSIVINLVMEKLVFVNNRYQETIEVASINELLERFRKRELIKKQYIVERNIRLEERERISLIIHNAVGHTISTGIMAMETTKALFCVDPDIAMGKLDVAKECVSKGLDLVRQAVRLIDYDSETVNSTDIIFAFDSHIEHFCSVSNIVVTHNLRDSACETTIPRIHGEFFISCLLELLSNIRHGNATACSVMFYLNQSIIGLEVSDNGTTFSILSEKDRNDRLKNGFGLKKIEEHVIRFGGDYKLSFSSGFTIQITIPIIKE